MNYVEILRQEIDAQLQGLPHVLLDSYTLLGLLFGIGVTNKHVHDAWSVWCNAANPTHPSLVVFQDLSKEVQDLDSKYRDGIISAVKSVHNAS